MTASASPPAAQSAPISVVIPCYRCAGTIERAVESVTQQSLRPLELILVDDASADGSLAALEAIRARHGEGWVRVIALRENVGAGEARNAGWAIARGDYVAFLDADDAWHPRKLEIQYAFMRAHPEVAASGHARRVLRAPAAPDPVGAPRVKQIGKAALLLSNRFVTPSAMVRTDVPLRFRAGQRFMEDHLLWMQIVCAGMEVAFIEAALADTFKPPFGAGGLSAQLWAMERAELGNYRLLCEQGSIGGAACACLVPYSLLKFARRLVLVALRRALG